VRAGSLPAGSKSLIGGLSCSTTAASSAAEPRFLFRPIWSRCGSVGATHSPKCARSAGRRDPSRAGHSRSRGGGDRRREDRLHDRHRDPPLDARLAERSGLRDDVIRTPLFGPGCAGASSVSRAADLARARPGSSVLLVGGRALLAHLALLGCAPRQSGGLRVVRRRCCCGDPLDRGSEPADRCHRRDSVSWHARGHGLATRGRRTARAVFALRSRHRSRPAR
jgi:hypothetical protein